MEIKWRNRQTVLRKRLICPLLVFALACGMVAAMPGLDGETEAVDFNQKCSVTVLPADPKNTEMAADLDKADVVLDVYQVAEAVPVDGYDTCDFRFLSGYEKLEELYGKDPDNEDWKRMAQSAARYALENGTFVENGNGAAVKSPIGDLGCGLYLLIARGNGITDYTTTVTQEDGAENIATIARSDKYVYTFAPELIALPGRQVRNEDGTIVNTTAGGGAWIYNMEVNLKPLQSLRYGSLEIVKTLLSYEVKDPATFIFDVSAVLGGETVFRDNVSITFAEGDNTGEKRVILEDRIPVGAEVTVEEVYSGAVYELTSSPVQTTTIEADNMASVAFTNDYNETNNGGGSVTNYFNQAEDGWHLQQIYDDGTVAEQGE